MELRDDRKENGFSSPSGSVRREAEGGTFDHDGPTPPPPPRLKSALSSSEPSTMPVTMPVPAAQAADDIARIGPEGRPADARSGPGMLMLEVGFVFVLVAAASIATGIWVGWGLGLAMFVVGGLALMINPVIGATAMRTKERQEAASQEHAGQKP